MVYVGIASLIVAMGVTWIATPATIRLARWLGAVDLPGGRKIHAEPIPRIGGLAVFLGFIAGLLFAAHATGVLWSTVTVSVYWSGLAAAALGMLLVGLADDLWGLSFQWKFVAQIIAAAFVWFCGFRIDILTHPLGGQLDLGALSLPLTILWVVAITNAVNLIDGLDGLATGIALITSVAVGVIALESGHLGVTAVAVALAGALSGFLWFNFNPARIFLGDSGSMFLGFVLAVAAVRGSQKGPTTVAILAPLLLLGLPLLDTGMAVVRRLVRLGHRGVQADDRTLGYIVRNLQQVFLPDRGHIHHQLLDFGLSHRWAVLVLYLVGGLFASSAFALVLLKSPWIAALLLGVLAVAVATFYLLLYLRIGTIQDTREGKGDRLDDTSDRTPDRLPDRIDPPRLPVSSTGPTSSR